MCECAWHLCLCLFFQIQIRRAVSSDPVPCCCTVCSYSPQGQAGLCVAEKRDLCAIRRSSRNIFPNAVTSGLLLVSELSLFDIVHEGFLWATGRLACAAYMRENVELQDNTNQQDTTIICKAISVRKNNIHHLLRKLETVGCMHISHEASKHKRFRILWIQLLSWNVLRTRSNADWTTERVCEQRLLALRWGWARAKNDLQWDRKCFSQWT